MRTELLHIPNVAFRIRIMTGTANLGSLCPSKLSAASKPKVTLLITVFVLASTAWLPLLVLGNQV